MDSGREIWVADYFDQLKQNRVESYYDQSSNLTIITGVALFLFLVNGITFGILLFVSIPNAILYAFFVFTCISCLASCPGFYHYIKNWEYIKNQNEKANCYWSIIRSIEDVKSDMQLLRLDNAENV